MNKKLFFSGSFLLLSVLLSAQDYFPLNDGVKTINTNYTLFTNATLHPTPETEIKSGSILIQNGKIIAVGKTVNAPKNAVLVNLQDKHVYPSFIDMYSSFGIEIPKRQQTGRSPNYDATRSGYYWNDHIRPETDALADFNYDAKAAKDLLEAGFGVVNTHKADAIARGTGILVALNSKGNTANRLLDTRSAQFFSFKKSNLSTQSYPTSIMGATALVRQVFQDMRWYETGNVITRDLALEALIANKTIPQIFFGNGLYDDLRIAKLGNEIEVPFIIVGGGDEYKRINEVKATGAKYIIPINFQDALDVEDPYQAAYINLNQMLAWNQAPTNPAKLEAAGISFALTPHALKSPSKFTEMLKKAIAHGLSETYALKALTTEPASLLGKENELGSLKKGAWANFIITSGPIFDDESILYENWVQGEKYVIKDADIQNIDGNYALEVNGDVFDVEILKSTKKPSVTIKNGETKLGSKITYDTGWLSLMFTSDTTAQKSFTRLMAQVSKAQNWKGKAVLANGNETAFVMRKKADVVKDSIKKTGETPKTPPMVLPLTYPNLAYGYDEKPKAQTLLFKNATVWTNENDGILKNTDVLVKNGKIADIGKNISAKDAKVIDATGKHVTSGIIDEHSHIAAFSINESGQNSSAEVRMADAINPDDIDIYRDLAGGVTAIQLLHGSANPIGGQSAVMKLKWGASIDEMLLENVKFIKFALGENVKQSNWSSFSRFPQTRMGVQQLYMDYFQRAKEYETLKQTGKPYRKDYEMETLVEILNGERFISSHSYVQSEINMLMKVAESFGFKVNTFTHILEGYKVADKMAEHGAAGSTFSDWWAYKYEVNDAIPYNAALMWQQGVLTAINSDDAEMSRRLNQEAAKAMKYGGVPEEEAWKFVTLNPAKMLHINDRTGSIKIGKDADLVLWSAYPMSVTAIAEKTLVDGVVYFDIENDKMLRKQLKEKKNTLVAMMLRHKNKGLKTQPAKKEDKQRFECETLETQNQL